ncbi:MAG: aminotransferase class I/II-fold pyridoxal phosphate-dependent enzyme, partial [Clostridia bacterium]|nr:aminotransferase class I/II-fold pyridoxal phosphate-dependent enzyme [Clostridia bacterium]
MDNSSGIYNLINNKQISKSIINVLANNIDFNTYSSPKGLKELRQQICIFLKNIWNYNINYHDMLITTGSQQSINIIANTILSAGDTILIEQPTYFGAIKVFKNKNINIIGTKINSRGINIKQ